MSGRFHQRKKIKNNILTCSHKQRENSKTYGNQVVNIFM
jgi:hypothetical protein